MTQGIFRRDCERRLCTLSSIMFSPLNHLLWRRKLPISANYLLVLTHYMSALKWLTFAMLLFRNYFYTEIECGFGHYLLEINFSSTAPMTSKMSASMSDRCINVNTNDNAYLPGFWPTRSALIFPVSMLYLVLVRQTKRHHHTRSSEQLGISLDRKTV